MRMAGQNPEPTVALRLARVLVVAATVIAAAMVAIATGAVKIPGFPGGSTKTQPSEQVALAAQRTAAEERWASTTCTSILAWKNEIQRDGTSLDLALGPSARVHDAIAASTRLLSELDKLGLPPGASPQAQSELDQLRADITSRVSSLEGAAGSVAGGNFGAIGTLIGDLESDRVLGTQITDELRHVVSVDLGLSLVETRACRQLVGIPI